MENKVTGQKVGSTIEKVLIVTEQSELPQTSTFEGVAELHLNAKTDVLIWLPRFDDLAIDANNVILVSVPDSLESSKLTLNTVNNTPKATLSMPFVIAKVGENVALLKRGDLVYPSNDIIHQSTHLAFDLDRRWKNAIITNDFLIKVGAVLSRDSNTYIDIINDYFDKIKLVEGKLEEELKLKISIASNKRTLSEEEKAVAIKAKEDIYSNLR